MSPKFDEDVHFAGDTVFEKGFQDRSSAILNIKTFGAVGNGVADDAPAIQAAISSLPTLGGVVLIPSGTFKLGSGVTIDRAGVTIQSVSNGSALIQFAGSSVNTAFRMADTTTRRVVLRDLRIESTNDGSGCAIDASYFTNAIIENCRIGNTGASPNKGIYFSQSGTFYNVVRDTRVQVKGASSAGITFTTNAQSNLISNIRALGDTTNSTGVLVDAHSNKLERVDCETNCLIGIDVTANGHSCFIDHPYLEGNGTGLRVANGVKSVYMVNGFIADNPTGGANNIVNSAAAGELQYRAVRVQFNTANL